MEPLEDDIPRTPHDQVRNDRIESEPRIGKVRGDEEVDAKEAVSSQAIGMEVNPGAIDAEQEDPVIRPRVRPNVVGQLGIRPGRVPAVVPVATESLQVGRAIDTAAERVEIRARELEDARRVAPLDQKSQHQHDCRANDHTTDERSTRGLRQVPGREDRERRQGLNEVAVEQADAVHEDDQGSGSTPQNCDGRYGRKPSVPSKIPQCDDCSNASRQPQRIGLHPQPHRLGEPERQTSGRDALGDIEAIEIYDGHSRIPQQLQAPQPDDCNGRQDTRAGKRQRDRPNRRSRGTAG